MRKRYQQGSLRKVKGKWHAQWWEGGHRKKKVFGLCSKITRSKALEELSKIVTPINARHAGAQDCSFKEFVNGTYLPFFKRRWKRSTAMTNEDRIKRHLLSEFGDKTMRRFSRGELQDCLDARAKSGLNFSTVDHLRWDLKQIFDLAVNEGFVERSPAAMIFTPREAKRTVDQAVMSIDDVRLCFTVLDLRERVIVKLAIVGGLRPGEIFGLRWSCVGERQADIRQRVYRGDIDTPKTVQSVRTVAFSSGLGADLQEWRSICPGADGDGWVFPSENPETPVRKDNLWRRYIAPRLKNAGLGWINFQVMRRTHSSLMNRLKVDPKVVAEQLGHTLDVNLNVYTTVGLDRRRDAVDLLESALLGA